MKVHWTDRAKARLRLIHDYIAHDAPLVAPQVVERLVARSIQIGEVPHTGRKVSEYGVTTCANCLSDLIALSIGSCRIASISSPLFITANFSQMT